MVFERQKSAKTVRASSIDY
ncbi:Protein of unknown function [Bacillus mycoides]|uniref:Uncharacterized protein n=1 Tax=Bacillus mycoides TaxID=1405 RepID=A0A1G4EDC1_BACMY|nr:Protein of unknown function [Bacillus mycoides]